MFKAIRIGGSLADENDELVAGGKRLDLSILSEFARSVRRSGCTLNANILLGRQGDRKN